MKAEFQIFSKGISDSKSLYRLMDKLADISKELYHNKSGGITQKITGLSPSLSAIFSYLEQKGLEPSGDSAQKTFIEEIINSLKEIPIVHVTLAFEPDESFKLRLNEEISSQAQRKIVLDMNINHHIVGGVILEFKGKYKDYSLEPNVDSYLKQTVQKLLTKELV